MTNTQIPEDKYKYNSERMVVEAVFRGMHLFLIVIEYIQYCRSIRSHAVAQHCFSIQCCCICVCCLQYSVSCTRWAQTFTTHAWPWCLQHHATITTTNHLGDSPHDDGDCGLLLMWNHPHQVVKKHEDETQPLPDWKTFKVAFIEATFQTFFPDPLKMISQFACFVYKKKSNNTPRSSETKQILGSIQCGDLSPRFVGDLTTYVTPHLGHQNGQQQAYVSPIESLRSWT